MGLFSIEEKTIPAVHCAAPDATDAWRGGWPQNAREFEGLVDAYLGRLVLYASRRLRNSHDAEDVVQDVFVRAFVDRMKLQGVADTGAYLYRMTANACTDRLRARHRGVRCVPFNEADEQSIAASQCSPSDVLGTAEEAVRAEKLLQRLPKVQAEAVRLRVFGELGLNEIARVTGCPINTVSSRLRYGFRKLRRLVIKEWKK